VIPMPSPRLGRLRVGGLASHSRSRVGFVLVDEKRQFSVEIVGMDDFACWLA
jgi:hypothetical protein